MLNPVLLAMAGDDACWMVVARRLRRVGMTGKEPV
jgi:hypothetical protein